MNEHMGLRGGHHLLTRSPGAVGVHIPVKLRGEWCITRRAKGSGIILGEHRFPNAIQSGGVTRLLDLVTGSSALHFDQANTDLEIYRSGPTLEKTLACTGVSHSVANQVTWTFRDETVDTYTVAQVRMIRGALDFTVASPSYSGGNAKPADENWEYTYTLSISATDSELDFAGLDHMLELMTGASALHFTNAAMALRVYSSASGPTTLGTYTSGQESGYPSVSGSQLTQRWTVPAGTLTGTWDFVEIYGNFGPDIVLRSIGTPTVADGFGSKTASAEWQYTHTMSLTT